jgi:hypothetical protein
MTRQLLELNGGFDLSEETMAATYAQMPSSSKSDIAVVLGALLVRIQRG